ncbi:MAG: hypothetical protein M1836_006078 [Candelina mexicana]|nr:MAG: hypothetical protein M1836_006078 [Candelina mexicana]
MGMAKKNRIPSANQSPPRPFLPDKFQIPERVSSVTSPEIQKQLQDLESSHLKLKRRASKMSVNRLDPKTSMEYLTNRKEQIRNLEQQWQLIIKAVKDAGPTIDLGGEEPDKFLGRCWVKRARLAQEDVTIARHERRIIDALRAAFNDAMEEPDVGAAYAEILTNIWQTNEKAPDWSARNPHKQETWAEELRQYYNVYNEEGLVWCPIVKDYAIETRTAAHIVPHSLGLANIGYLFGNPDEGYKYVWSMKNGLIMHSSLEKQFDKGEFIIIPAPAKSESSSDESTLSNKLAISPQKDAPGSSKSAPVVPPRTHSLPANQRTSPQKAQNTKDEPVRLVFKLLNKSIAGARIGGSGPEYGFVDGKELVFKNNKRPGLRFLYYHYISTILRYVRYEKANWAQHRVEIPTGQIWASPGAYLRRSMLKKLASAIGDNELDDGLTNNTTFEGDDNKSEEEEEIISKEIVLRKEIPLLKAKGEWIESVDENNYESDNESDDR